VDAPSELEEGVLMLEETKSPGAAEGPRPTGSAPVVLLAEGHVALPGSLQRMLRRKGYQAVTAGTCAELIQTALSLRPDVLVCELQLPDGDSLAAMRALRNQGYRGAAVALTAFKAQTHMGRALASGFDAYLEKPLTLMQLTATLDSYVAGRDVERPQ
jgi:CheY-like chemotaxis protein